METRQDIFREPEFDPNTLANLGPLSVMAGVWLGDEGVDVHPTAQGPRSQAFIERYEAHPIDPQTNGPQLYYGLRYHTHITLADQEAAFHDQVGYWLWEPATQTVLLTLAIPRGQTALATGTYTPGSNSFTLRAVRGETFNGILSNPFLEKAFKTTQYEMTVTLGPGDTWAYEQTTTLQIRDQAQPFLHTDHNRLKKIGPPKPNPASLIKG